MTPRIGIPLGCLFVVPSKPPFLLLRCLLLNTIYGLRILRRRGNRNLQQTGGLPQFFSQIYMEGVTIVKNRSFKVTDTGVLIARHTTKWMSLPSKKHHDKPAFPILRDSLENNFLLINYFQVRQPALPATPSAQVIEIADQEVCNHDED